MYWFAYVIAPAAQLVGVQSIMSYWVDTDRVPQWAWITAFIFIPVIFNFLAVRRFGEGEFVLTALKMATIVGLIIIGILLPWGASAGTRKLGYVEQHSTDGSVTLLDAFVSCPDPLNPPAGVQCLPSPGFACIFSCVLI